MAVVCNPLRMGRWSELVVVCVCHLDEVMREVDANDTSGELGLALPGSLVGESVFRTAKLEVLTELLSVSCYLRGRQAATSFRGTKSSMRIVTFPVQLLHS